MQYTQVPSDAFEKLQLNAGILVDSFTPASGTIGNILGATSGGVTFASNPTYTDYGEDIDNVPANTWQLKRITSYDPYMSGTFKTVSAAIAKQLAAAADIDSKDSTKIVPRQTLLESDFTELWWVGDYSDKNTGTNAGFIAIHLIKALNTTGFQIASSKDSKGDMAFEFHGHYDLDSIDTVPFEIYVKAGTAA